jgi:hypothetical protein
MNCLSLNKVQLDLLIIILYSKPIIGVGMTIRQGDPPVYAAQVMHAELTQHIADLIARIKMGGGAGVRSELNFCLYCRTRLSSLSVPAGYMRKGMQFPSKTTHYSNLLYQIFRFVTPMKTSTTHIFGNPCRLKRSGARSSSSQATDSRRFTGYLGGIRLHAHRQMQCICFTLAA